MKCYEMLDMADSNKSKDCSLGRPGPRPAVGKLMKPPLQIEIYTTAPLQRDVFNRLSVDRHRTQSVVRVE